MILYISLFRKRSKEDDYYGYHKVKKQEERRGGENSESRREAEMYKKRIEDLKKIRESKPSSNRDEVSKFIIFFIYYLADVLRLSSLVRCAFSKTKG